MKSHFRKTEHYTQYCANTPVELDSEKFPDFSGETEEEFLEYIHSNIDEWIDEGTLNDFISDEETREALTGLKEDPMEILGGSYEKFFQGSLQVGIADESHRDGFKVNSQLDCSC